MSQLATLHPLDILAAESRNGRGINGARPPTSIRGYVEDAAFDGILADILELVPDCAWPTSVQTFQSMRRDAKLAAIISGYELQLRRAQWQLDGTDCRPEVVSLVADDLGIPVKGADRHGAARTRGVSWHEHLRGALTMLPFGHAGFELQAEIVDGRARLIGLWDRPQHTIHTIHVEPRTGRFNGVSQELGKVTWDEPEIRPERLAWYAHQREGAQWFGVSLLRPAFAPWLLKREMQRVLATSSRRFGMGVPTVKWAPNATPTPQQFSEGQRAASAARVGDQSGLTLPPGAILELVGMSGGAPDTLGFIKWLDQQMAVSALMQHLDLGQTQTGSRALGESFIDSWTLALEAIGEEIADVATRQIAARIVGWNWGSDEPVPRVTVTGVGSRREVTAESLKLLLDSGALAFDPGLEEWARREWRIPARTEPRPAVVQAPDRAAATPAGEPAPATRPEPAQQVQAAAEPTEPAVPVRYEQPELPIAAAEPDQPEDEQDDEMRQVEEDSTTALLVLLAAWPLLAAPLADALAAGTTAVAVSGTFGTLATLELPAGVVDDIASAIGQAMISLGAASADRARAGVAAHGVQVEPAALDANRLRQVAEATTGLIVAGYRSAATRAALNTFGPGVDPNLVGDSAARAMDDLSDTTAREQPGRIRGFVAAELASALHTAAHWGRVGVFRVLDALGLDVTWRADESNEDRNRCRPCATIHGTTFGTLGAGLAAYPSGKYVGCLGRQRCRGALRAQVGGVTAARVWNEADHPRDHRGRFRRLLSMDIAGDRDLTKMPEPRLSRLFAEFMTEQPPNEPALLKLNAELERRERQAERERQPNPLVGVNLADLSDDQLLDLWSEHRHRDDVRQPVNNELAARRRRFRSVGDSPLIDWGQDTPASSEQQRIDDLVSRGVDYRDAYAEVYDLSQQQLRGQERGVASERRRAEVRRAYRDFITLQMLEAETDLRGHMLSPQARAQGIDPLSLFSGPAARARRWASEDLRRWWADHPRVTYAEFAAGVAGGGRVRVEEAVFATPGQVT